MINEVGTEKTMTVKEVSDVLGVTAEAIKKHIRNQFPEIIKNGVTTRLTESQVVEIKKKNDTYNPSCRCSYSARRR